jgi:glycerate-2-kinase
MRQVKVHDGVLHLPDGRHVALRGRAVRVAAIGKAAGTMSAHAQPWGPFDEVVVSAPYPVDVAGFESYVGGHPLPDAQSVKVGERVLELAQATGPDDLLIVLLSGGASAMCEAPEVPLADLRRATELLLRSGAPIADVNLARRHLSRIKGGGLARACRGELVVLAISDVDDPATLGSGPTVDDGSTSMQAHRVLERQGIAEAMPRSVMAHLGNVHLPTPPFRAAPVLVLADNSTALRAAAAAALRLGYAACLMPGWLEGEARERGRELGRIARDGRGVALLAGGETTVRLVGHGQGGRNQEVALAAVDAVSGRDVVLATLGTDGVDGPTDAAGAIVDGFTLARGDALGLDAHALLLENDSYHYFEPLDDLIRTGVTGTNVRDIAVVLTR